MEGVVADKTRRQLPPSQYPHHVSNNQTPMVTIIPSIVVHSGSTSTSTMECRVKQQRKLSKQSEFEESDSLEGGALLRSKENSMERPEEDSNVSAEGESLKGSSRARSHGKLKLLVRSHALREETSPPREPDNPTINQSSSCHKLLHQGSSQGSMDSSSSCLSRDNSIEYTDSTGVDLHLFISETLNKNQRDRILLLKLEQELVAFIRDNKCTSHKFPPMSSYQRMLVHRAAAFFGLEHNIDMAGNSVIVSKGCNTRIPDLKFKDHIRDEFLFPEEPQRSILKRDSSSFEESCTYKDGQQRNSSQEDLNWSSVLQPWINPESDSASGSQSNIQQQIGAGRLLKVESFEGRDTLKANSLRLSVSKSYSFGGYPVSTTNIQTLTSRHLTKQDSGGSSSMSSRLSPSSSGYKSQSQRSDTTLSATPSPTATPSAQQISQLTLSDSNDNQPVIWAVTNISAVPPGSVLINPQTGQPYLNSDGSIYRYDPLNPPKIISEENSIRSTELNNIDNVKDASISVTSTTNKSISPVNLITTATSTSLPENPSDSTESAQLLMYPDVSTSHTEFSNTDENQPSQILPAYCGLNVPSITASSSLQQTVQERHNVFTHPKEDFPAVVNQDFCTSNQRNSIPELNSQLMTLSLGDQRNTTGTGSPFQTCSTPPTYFWQQPLMYGPVPSNGSNVAQTSNSGGRLLPLLPLPNICPLLPECSRNGAYATSYNMMGLPLTSAADCVPSSFRIVYTTPSNNTMNSSSSFYASPTPFVLPSYQSNFSTHAPQQTSGQGHLYPFTFLNPSDMTSHYVQPPTFVPNISVVRTNMQQMVTSIPLNSRHRSHLEQKVSFLGTSGDQPRYTSRPAFSMQFSAGAVRNHLQQLPQVTFSRIQQPIRMMSQVPHQANVHPFKGRRLR